MVARTRPGCILPAAVPSPIEIVVNGDPRTVEHGTSVRALVEQLGLASDQVAVERNRIIVPRAEHAAVELAPGDALEIVTFVGGG